MTDAHRMVLLRMHQDLMREVAPLEDRLRLLHRQLVALETEILRDLQPRWVSRLVHTECGEVVMLEQVAVADLSDGRS